jgi:DNA mismatch repair protein MutS
VPEELVDLPEEITQNFNCSKRSSSLFDEKITSKIIKETFNINSLECFGYPEFKLGLISAGVILDYIKETQKQNIPKFDVISPYSLSSFVSIDANTRKNLELTETSREKNKKRLASLGNRQDLHQHGDTPFEQMAASAAARYQ